MRKGSKWQVPEALRKWWASKDEAATELSVSIDTIEKWIKDGRLSSRPYHGGRVLILRESIAAMVAPFMR